MEHFKIKYLKSIIKVLKEHKAISEEDRTNLNQCIGTLFHEIQVDGDMTKKLDLEFLLPGGF